MNYFSYLDVRTSCILVFKKKNILYISCKNIHKNEHLSGGLSPFTEISIRITGDFLFYLPGSLSFSLSCKTDTLTDNMPNFNLSIRKIYKTLNFQTPLLILSFLSFNIYIVSISSLLRLTTRRCAMVCDRIKRIKISYLRILIYIKIYYYTQGEYCIKIK